MFVKVAPAAPDRLFHQSIRIMKMDRLHRLEELKRDMKKSRRLVGRERIQILQPNSPDSPHFRVFRKWPRHIPERRGGGVLGGEFCYPRASMHLNREIPKRSDYADRADQLCYCVDRFPVHSLSILNDSVFCPMSRVPCPLSSDHLGSS